MPHVPDTRQIRSTLATRTSEAGHTPLPSALLHAMAHDQDDPFGSIDTDKPDEEHCEGPTGNEGCPMDQ
jgi:hypothetical protein